VRFETIVQVHFENQRQDAYAELNWIGRFCFRGRRSSWTTLGGGLQFLVFRLAFGREAEAEILLLFKHRDWGGRLTIDEDQFVHVG